MLDIQKKMRKFAIRNNQKNHFIMSEDKNKYIELEVPLSFATTSG